jgi:hypothetical protein
MYKLTSETRRFLKGDNYKISNLIAKTIKRRLRNKYLKEYRKKMHTRREEGKIRSSTGMILSLHMGISEIKYYKFKNKPRRCRVKKQFQYFAFVYLLCSMQHS